MHPGAHLVLDDEADEAAVHPRLEVDVDARVLEHGFGDFGNAVPTGTVEGMARQRRDEVQSPLAVVPIGTVGIGDEPADHGVLRELLGREVEDVRHGHRGVGPVGSATIKMRTRLLILNDALHPVRVPRGHESRTVGTGGGYSIRLVAGKGPARRALLAEVGVLEALPCHRAGLDHHNDHRPEG